MALLNNEYDILDDYVIIKITNRKGKIFEILIDKEDFEKVKVLNWHVTFRKKIKGYYAIHSEYLGTFNEKRKFKLTYMHRYIMNESDRHVDIDHLYHETLDNRKSNLKRKSRKDNSTNRKGLNTNNMSGYRNVCWIDGKWWVQLQVEGKNTRLKGFKDVHKAGIYAAEMREKYYGQK